MAETERAISKLNKIQRPIRERDFLCCNNRMGESSPRRERMCGASSYIQSWNKVISIGIRYKLRNSSLLTYRKKSIKKLAPRYYECLPRLPD